MNTKQYILLIHNNAKSTPTSQEWDEFFISARESGLFAGGSQIGNRAVIGDANGAASSQHIVGYMRFNAERKQDILDLLEQHPVVAHGGSVELCDMPGQ